MPGTNRFLTLIHLGFRRGSYYYNVPVTVGCDVNTLQT